MNSLRQRNLKKLVDAYSTQADLAIALGVTPGYVNQLCNGFRPISEKTARKIEKNLNLLPFSLDKEADGIEREIIMPAIDQPTQGICQPKSYYLPSLIAAASPNTRNILETIEKADQEGRLTHEDTQLLESIVKRLTHDKNSPHR